jgi:hypothetical protein
MNLIIGAIYESLAWVNGEKIPRKMKLVSADLEANRFVLKSTESFLTAVVNRATFEEYFKLLTED